MTRVKAVSGDKGEVSPMHVLSLVKIPWYLLKLSSGNENMGMSRADNSIKIWGNLPISNPKPDLHNINAHTKFGENPLMFTQVIIWKHFTKQEKHWSIKRRKLSLTLVMLNKLKCHTHFYSSDNQINWSRFTYLLTNSADPDQLASSEANWSVSTLFAKVGHIRV